MSRFYHGRARGIQPALVAVRGKLAAMLSLLAPAAREPNAIDRALPTLTDQAGIFDVRLSIALIMVALFVAALVWRSLAKPPALDERTRARANLALTIALVVAALASSINYFYAERNNGVWLHRWDAFHTVIGAKYFDELGYQELYVCSLAIDRQGPGHFRGVDKVRDLHTLRVVPVAEALAGAAQACEQRFTPERLQQFRRDLDAFGRFSNRGMWKDLFRDKGFNGTPYYLWVTEQLVARVPVELEPLRRLAYLDVGLMLLAFVAVAWAYGVRAAAIVAIYFCVDFPNRFEHMGGSILRFDYVAALLIGFAAIKRGWWACAGVLLAWACMVRVFPAIFVAGLALKLGLDWHETRRWQPEHGRFALAFTLACATMFAISIVGLEGGFANYLTWYADMKEHTATSAAFRVGFRHMFMLEGNLTGSEGFVDYAAKQQAFARWQPLYWAATLGLLWPLVKARAKLDALTFALLFGVFGFFLLTIATRYYYAVLCLLLLVDRDLLRDRHAIGLALLLFVGAAINYAWWPDHDFAPFMYNTLIGLELTATIAVVGLALLRDPAFRDVEPSAAPLSAPPQPLPSDS